MEIRRLTSGDEGLVRAAAYLFEQPPDDAAARAFLADPRNYLLIAYLDGQPAGFVRAHELQQLGTTKLQMFLYEIEIAPRFRRRGAARALLAELERICRERGFQEMFAITNYSNIPAMRLYESMGARREAPDDVVFVFWYDDEPETAIAGTIGGEAATE